MKPLRFCLVASLAALGLILAVSWTTVVRAETLRYSGQLFEFPHKRMVFIDITTEEHTKIGPSKFKFSRIGPMIIDKKRGPEDVAKYEEFPLNENGGFILRFVLQNVDPELIKKIYMAEFNVPEEMAISDINKFLDELTNIGKNGKPALLKKKDKMHQERPGKPMIEPARRFAKPLEIKLDVGLNQMGGGGFKIPPR